MKKILGLLLFLTGTALYAQDENASSNKVDQSVEKGATEQALVNVYEEGTALVLPLDGINFIGSTITCVRVQHGSVFYADCTLTGGGSSGMATDTLWDAAGDLAYGTGADTGAALAKGTATQVLHSGTTPSWSAIVSADITDGTIVNADIANGTIDLTTKPTGLLPFANLADGTATSVLARSAASAGVMAPVSAIGPNVTISNGPTGVPRLGLDPRTQFFMYEDLGQPVSTTTNPGCQNACTSTVANSPGNYSVGTATAEHPGIVIMTTGATAAASTEMIRTGTNYLANHDGLTGECMIQITTTALGKVGCGFNDNTGGPDTATDGMLIYYDGSDTHWIIRNRQGGAGNASTSNTTITMGSGVWHRLTIYVETASTGANTGIVHYYVDGTELNVSPLTADVPQGSQNFGFEVGFAQLSGNSVEIMRLDYFTVYGPLSR